MTAPFVRELCRRHCPQARQRLYTLPVVFWLMISQRLQAPGTLAQAVARMRRKHLRGWWRRVRRVSRRTGGYCRARMRAPIAAMKELYEYLTAELEQRVVRVDPRLGRGVYIVDGSSLAQGHSPELLQRYPPVRNQHGTSHWPMVKMVVLHEAQTGLAVAPAWGPMCGPHAVSEQALAEQVFAALPPGAIVLGDRNFGVFATAYSLQQRQCAVVLRLTQSRAQRLAGGKRRPGSEQRVVWSPTAADQKTHPGLCANAQVAGRLIVAQWAGWREPLYLFTTLELPAAEVVELYGLRWNIETDLRSLKQTVRLEQMQVKSEGMLEKELWVALTTYNLVRAILCLAALHAHIHPRELSFTHVFYLVEASLPDLMSDPASPPVRRALQRLIREAADCRLPKRKNRRSYPRQLWLKRRRYPVRPTAPAPVK